MKKQDLNNALANALYLSEYDDARQYLENGACPNHDTGDGISPFLFLCMAADRPELLRDMIVHGADIAQRDKKNRDGLYLAKIAGHRGNIRLLTEMGIESALKVEKTGTTDHKRNINAPARNRPDRTTNKSTNPKNDGVLLFHPNDWRFRRRNRRIACYKSGREMAM